MPMVTLKTPRAQTVSESFFPSGGKMRIFESHAYEVYRQQTPQTQETAAANPANSADAIVQAGRTSAP